MTNGVEDFSQVSAMYVSSFVKYWFKYFAFLGGCLLFSNININMCLHAKLLKLCPTLCDPMDYSPPNSSVHGILQARKLEWVAMPALKGSSQPRDRTQVSYVS